MCILSIHYVIFLLFLVIIYGLRVCNKHLYKAHNQYYDDSYLMDPPGRNPIDAAEPLPLLAPTGRNPIDAAEPLPLLEKCTNKIRRSAGDFMKFSCR